MNDDAVGDRFQPHFTSANQLTGDRPAQSLLRSVHEYRQGQSRPPGLPPLRISDDRGNDPPLNDDVGLIYQVDSGHTVNHIRSPMLAGEV